MKSLLIAAAAAVLAGCTVVPTGTVHQACRVVAIAAAEAEMAPAWYVSAWQVLERCGVPDARERAEASACAAERRAGYGYPAMNALWIAMGWYLWRGWR
ncbi:hypothetical protein MI467_03410 [Delftia acidovorans]|uniref:hypothetical protein n=1 Tax=Delftia acidovorans TaxID=80866 RepID=UPI001EFEAEAC|nr:hypothetical protein [Delftia acidovorans]MCG8985885.1 hypothetical protein [Delftia acidovorans]